MARHPPRQPSQPTIPQRKQRPDPPANTYTPPPGIPADPHEFLALLTTGTPSPEAAAYLHSAVALLQYEAAIGAAHAAGVAGADIALAEQIADAWRAWIFANPAPPAGNPFGGV